MERIELSNLKSISTLGEKENYRYLEILEADTTKQVEMKEKVGKEYFRRIKKKKRKKKEKIEIKLCTRNLIKGRNTADRLTKKQGQ